MANGNIPEPTPGVPWYQDGRFIIVVLGMVFGFATSNIQSCVAVNNSRDASKTATAAVVKADENSAKTQEIKESVDKIDKKSDRIKAAVEK